MIVEIAEKIANEFVENKVIDEEEKDVYKYGTELMVSQFIGIGIVFLLGTIFGLMWETITFIICFVMIRVYAGGFHASSYRNCLISFGVSYIGILLLGEWINKNQLSNWVMLCLIFAGIIIFILAPIEDKNKPLDGLEYQRCRVKARKQTVLWSTLVCISYWSMPNKRTIIVYGALAICELAVLLIAGLIKNKRYAKEEKDDYSCNMR